MQKIILKRTSDFLKMKTVQNLPIFLNWTHKNIPDRQKICPFSKIAKRTKSLHPTVSCIVYTPHMLFNSTQYLAHVSTLRGSITINQGNELVNCVAEVFTSQLSWKGGERKVLEYEKKNIYSGTDYLFFRLIAKQRTIG